MAKKTIKIDDKEVTFLSNSATPYLYREAFHRDVIADMRRIMENWKKGHDDLDFSCIEKIAFIMAKQGGSENTEDIVKWLSQFDGLLSVYQALPDIVEVWKIGNETQVQAKKK